MKIKRVELRLKKTKKTLLLEFLQKITSEENKNEPFTDEKLKDIFEKKYNVLVSRKTISKYRTMLKISSSHDRKLRS